MKKVIFGCFVIALFLFISGCSQETIKNSYNSDEDIVADYYRLKVNKVTYYNDVLSISFNITNKSNNAVTLSPDDNFKFYIDNIQLKNVYRDNFTNIINSNETIDYIVSYNVKAMDKYEIFFYSGVVENNIKINIVENMINE